MCFTFPAYVSSPIKTFLFYAGRSDPANHQLLGILKQRTNDVDLKRYCLTLMERTGSFDYTVS